MAADLLADVERQGKRVVALSFACVCALDEAERETERAPQEPSWRRVS